MLNNQNGISLLALIIAIIILSIGTVSILPLMIQTNSHPSPQKKAPRQKSQGAFLLSSSQANSNIERID
jgi:Tfp pilus assembly protein PilV